MPQNMSLNIKLWLSLSMGLCGAVGAAWAVPNAGAMGVARAAESAATEKPAEPVSEEDKKLAEECAKLGFGPGKEGQEKAKAAAEGEGPTARKAAMCRASVPIQALKGGTPKDTPADETPKAEATKPTASAEKVAPPPTGSAVRVSGPAEYADESKRGFAAAYGADKAQGYADAVSGKTEATKLNKSPKYDEGMASGLNQVMKSTREGTRDGAQRTVDVNRVAYDQAYAKAAAKVQSAPSVAEGETLGISRAQYAVVRPGELITPGVPNNDRTLVNEAAVRQISTRGGPVINEWANSLNLDSSRLSSDFGPRNTGIPGASRYHRGIDLAGEYKKPVTVPAGGTVVRSSCSRSGYGCQVMVDHGNGYATLYGHLTGANMPRLGQNVMAGQQIGNVGNTGTSSGPHLHFEVRYRGSQINPASIRLADMSRGAQPTNGGQGVQWAAQPSGPRATPVAQTVATVANFVAPQMAQSLNPVVQGIGQLEQAGAVRVSGQQQGVLGMITSFLGGGQGGGSGGGGGGSGGSGGAYQTAEPLPIVDFDQLDPETRQSVLDQWGVTNGVTNNAGNARSPQPNLGFCQGTESLNNSGLVRGICLL